MTFTCDVTFSVCHFDVGRDGACAPQAQSAERQSTATNEHLRRAARAGSGTCCTTAPVVRGPAPVVRPRVARRGSGRSRQ